MFYPILHGVVEIDDEDLSLISCFKWSAPEFGVKRKIKYAQTTVYPGKKLLRMHRLISGFPDDDVDHIDGNGLNNKKDNLRVVSHRENHNNRHDKRVVGVYKHKQADRWFSMISYNNKSTYLGIFIDPISPKIMYDFVKNEIEGG